MANTKEEHKNLSIREQIRLRPGMWIGSSKPTEISAAVLDDGQLVDKELEIVPALVKIIEEIIANSVDEHIETKENPKKRGWTLDNISVELSSTGLLKVRDNGGITTAMHSSGIRTVEMIFGKFFSSSNYDDTQERKKVGTNGVGSKATNCMSSAFSVETADSKNALQIDWSDGMQNPTERYFKKSKEHFTETTAQIDLSLFNVESISYGTLKYIERMCILSAAANPGLTISYNEQEFKFNTFKEYVEMYGYGELIGAKNDHWEYWIAPVPAGEGDKHYGLVNGVGCDRGTVAKMINGWIWEGLREHLKSSSFKKENDGEIIEPTSGAMSSRYVVFTNASIVNPEYDSQSKDNLTTDVRVRDKKGTLRWRKFESKEALAESSIVDSLVDWYRQKKNAEEATAVRKKTRELKGTSPKSLRKLIDATGKTKKQREGSQLWIFEGDSAGKSFRPTRDSKTQGALFLRGKCKNSFSMSTLKLISNEEFQNIIVAFGLNPSKPDDLSKCRYTDFVIATDADVDGASICAQLITFFAMHFPEVIRQGRLKRANTPVYVSSKGKERQYFYSEDDFHATNTRGWKSKYMKGLGSLEKEHYRDMLANPNLVQFEMDDNAVKCIGDWMGGSSTPRKKYLSA